MRQKGCSFPFPWPLCWCPSSNFSLTFRPLEHRSEILPGSLQGRYHHFNCFCLLPEPLSTNTVESPPICSLHALVFLPGGPRHAHLQALLYLAVISKGDFMHSQNSLAFFKAFHLENYPREVHMAACIGRAPCTQWYRRQPNIVIGVGALPTGCSQLGANSQAH